MKKEPYETLDSRVVWQSQWYHLRQDRIRLPDGSEGQYNVVERLGGRLTCRGCGANYHEKNMPPGREGVCDVCGGELYRRDDDRPESVRNRLRVYEAQTADLIDYYASKDLLRRLSGDSPADEVYAKAREALSLSTR